MVCPGAPAPSTTMSIKTWSVSVPLGVLSPGVWLSGARPPLQDQLLVVVLHAQPIPPTVNPDTVERDAVPLIVPAKVIPDIASGPSLK